MSNGNKDRQAWMDHIDLTWMEDMQQAHEYEPAGIKVSVFGSG